MRRFLLLAILLYGCSPDRSAVRPPFPAAAAGWTLSGSPAPTTPMAGARRAWAAMYRGEPDIHAVLHEMPSQASAFEALQKRRPSPGELTFYKGRYFGVAAAPGADQRTLNRFVAAFEENMPQ